MNVRKLIFVGSATALGLGLAGLPAASFADDSPSMAPARPIVTQSAGTFTVTLPGVGSLNFGVDPTTGAITALTVTPAQGSGFTAGAPMTTEEGVQVRFTGASGSQLLEVKVDRDEAVTEVEAEVEGPPLAQPGAGAPGNDRDGEHGETSTTSTPGTATDGDDNGMDNGDDNATEAEPGDDDQQTTTTQPAAPAPSTSGDESGSSDSGSDGGGSGSGDSGDHGSGGDGSSDGGSGSGGGSGGDSGSHG